MANSPSDQPTLAAPFGMAETSAFVQDVFSGLAATPKRLSCKYFYDEHGSRLFDAICELDEYYLTRTELGILEREMTRVANGKAVVLPITDETRGHGTHSIATTWQAHLAELLERWWPRKRR